VQTLGNAELDAILTESILCGDSLNDSNAVHRLQIRWNHDLDISNEIAFIAPRFSQLEHLDELNVEQLDVILARTDLVLDREEWLLDFIIANFKDYRSLLRYVKCQYLSQDGVEKFISCVAPDSIDGMLWSSICNRLRSTTRFPAASIPFAGNEFDGIIAALTRRQCQNVCKAGVVEITPSSQQGGDAYNLVDYSWRGNWFTENKENSWVCLQFKTGRVTISSYTIRSCSGDSWPMNWVIEVSDDNAKWDTIDRREDTKVLCGEYVSHHFDCQSPCKTMCRSVRMRNIGVTKRTNHHLCLCNIEFFGIFLENAIWREHFGTVDGCE
jgi:hypothetical protein